MEPLMFVMAILGCGESDAACREVRLAEARYRSEAECIAATEAELLRHEDLPFPTVVAQCRAANAPVRVLRGSDVLMPESGTLPAEQPRMAQSDQPPPRPQ